jgi:hypothetical protein
MHLPSAQGSAERADLRRAERVAAEAPLDAERARCQSPQDAAMLFSVK